MKKFFLVLLTAAFTLASFANPVDVQKARRVAINFWNANRPADVREVADMQLIEVPELSHQYIFAVGETGFVIVSADDCVPPVIGHSFDSPATQELNPEVRYWLESIDAQIAAWDGVDGAANPQWAGLSSDDVVPMPLTASNILPLCSTRWGQDYPYNRYCPWDTVENDRAVVGCVATAMAQIMKRWNHPSCGTGSHEYHHFFMDNKDYDYGVLNADFAHTTYMWQDMPDKASSIASDKVVKAVATLSYHCGVSVDMMYGTTNMGGSGAFSSCGGWASECAENAFYKYFKYSSGLQYRQRNHYQWNGETYEMEEVFDYDDSTWQAMIDAEIEAGRPLYYSGSDYSGGHAFVLDGRYNDRYHFNWGWEGGYDGYYLLSNLAPGGGGTGGNATYTFNHDQGAIFGIEPLPEVFDTIHVSDSVCEMASPYEFYEYELESKATDTILHHLDTVFVLHLDAVLSNFAVFNPNNGTLSDQIEVEYCRFDGLVMPECTFEKPGKFFIGWAQKKSGPATLYMPGDTLWISGNQNFFARWQDTAKASIADLDVDKVRMWPNPVEEVLNISMPESGKMSLYVIDALGRIRKSTEVEGSEAKIDFSDIPAGLYFVRIATENSVYNKRIVRY